MRICHHFKIKMLTKKPKLYKMYQKCILTFPDVASCGIVPQNRRSHNLSSSPSRIFDILIINRTRDGPIFIPVNNRKQFQFVRNWSTTTGRNCTSVEKQHTLQPDRFQIAAMAVVLFRSNASRSVGRKANESPLSTRTWTWTECIWWLTSSRTIISPSVEDYHRSHLAIYGPA
jgi:hypothetical protein